MTTHRQLRCLKTLQQGQPCRIGNRTAHLSGGNDTVLCFDGFDVLCFFLYLFFSFFFYSFFILFFYSFFILFFYSFFILFSFLLFYYYFIIYILVCGWLLVEIQKLAIVNSASRLDFALVICWLKFSGLGKEDYLSYSKQKVTNVLQRSTFTGHVISLCDSLRESFYARIKYI